MWAEKREFLIKKDKPREWGKCQKRQVQNRHPGHPRDGYPTWYHPVNVSRGEYGRN
jgi:hypothetical protein